MSDPLNPAELEVTVEKLVYGGHGLSRTEGRVLLTPLVLPGERAIVQPVDKLHARLIRLEQRSPGRVEAPCPYFGTCGGCHYQHAPYAYQLEQKREILREVMRRVAKFEPPDDIPVISGEEWNYRNRTQLHVREGETGYLRMGSHELCPINACPISSPRLNEVIGALSRMAKDRRFPRFIRTVELFTNEREVQLNVLDTEKPLAKHFFDWCAGEIPGYAPGAIEYTAGGDRFRVGPRSFFQVNRFLLEALREAACPDPATGGQRALDLYAGVGLFSLPLSKAFEHVTAVESSASAVADLRRNVPAVEPVRAPVDEYLAALTDRPDFVLADPPREGLGKNTVRELIRLEPRRLHIVSCDPATLARDLRMLLDAGYALERMMLADLFPQTYHLETVVHLRRK